MYNPFFNPYEADDLTDDEELAPPRRRRGALAANKKQSKPVVKIDEQQLRTDLKTLFISEKYNFPVEENMPSLYNESMHDASINDILQKNREGEDITTDLIDEIVENNKNKIRQMIEEEEKRYNSRRGAVS